MTGDRSVIVLSDEARKYLRPTTPADLERSSAARKKQRAITFAEIAEIGGVAEAITRLTRPDRKFVAEDIQEALLLADDATRARCEQIAELLWAENPTLHVHLLECLPHRADWAAELARSSLAAKRIDARDTLLSTLTDGELLVQLVGQSGLAATIVHLVPALREKAAPILGALLEAVRFPNEEKAVARALGCIGTPEAAAIFVKHLRKSNVRPYATAFFACFPHLAEGALAEVAAKKTQVAEIARTILAGLDRAQATREPSSSSEDSSKKTSSEEASEDELPEVLRTPPWAAKAVAKKRKPLTVTGLEVPLKPLRLHWSTRARRRWVAEHWQDCGVLRSEDESRELEASIAKGESAYLYANHAEPFLIRLLSHKAVSVHAWRDTIPQALALFGEGVLAPIVLGHADKIGVMLQLRVESPRLALSFKRWDERARRWSERFPLAAALGLIPPAIGDDDALRKTAEPRLRHLARGHRATVEHAAATYGAAAEAAVAELLASGADDSAGKPKKAPKMPPIYRAGELRAPRLRNGKVLPRASVEVLDQLLAASTLPEPLPGLDAIRKACEPRSLAEHAWDLARAWDINGAKATNSWMLHAVAHLGDDEVVRRLTPALKGEGIAGMLGAIGTDAALMELVTILVRLKRAQITKWPKYAWGTEEAILLIAAQRGVDIDELEDRFVPTCGAELEEAGPASIGIPLDLGKRTYRVSFDPQLARVLTDEGGARVSALPRLSLIHI